MKLQLAQSQPHEPNGCVRNILHWRMKDETFIHSLPIPHRNECRVINQVFSPICPSHSNNQPCAAYALKESAYTHLPICIHTRVQMKIINNSMDPPGRVRWAIIIVTQLQWSFISIRLRTLVYIKKKIDKLSWIN